jgi:hypothetical protein
VIDGNTGGKENVARELPMSQLSLPFQTSWATCAPAFTMPLLGSVLVFLGYAPLTAQAAFVTYSDRSAFEAASGFLSSEGFEDASEDVQTGDQTISFDSFDVSYSGSGWFGTSSAVNPAYPVNTGPISVETDVAFEGLLRVLERRTRCQSQGLAGDLLLRASIPCGIDVGEFIDRVLPGFSGVRSRRG